MEASAEGTDISGGPEALAAARTWPATAWRRSRRSRRSTYDLVLMDVQMPELDGLEATQRIRARELCLAAGIDDYIRKPIRPAELEAVLEVTPSSPNGAVDG